MKHIANSHYYLSPGATSSVDRKKSKKTFVSNILSFLAYVYIALIASAQYVPGIKLPYFNIFGSRLTVVFIGLVIAVGYYPFDIKLSKNSKLIITSIFFWCFWGVLLVIALGGGVDAFKDSAYILFGASSIAIYSSISLMDNFSDKVLKGLWIGFLSSISIGVWEIVTMNHLDSAYTANAPYWVMGAPFAQSTWGNPNDFSAFLVYISPLLVYSFDNAKFRKKLLYLSLIILSGFIIITNESRNSLMVMVLYMTIIILFKNRKNIFIKILALSMIVITVSFIFYDNIIGLTSAGNSVQSESFAVRMNMYKNAIWMTLNSYGIGFGPASYAEMAVAGDLPYYVGDNTSIHSLLLEISSQYGIISMILVASSVVNTVYVSNKYSKTSKISKISRDMMLLFALTSFQGSSYVNGNALWFVMCVSVAVTNREYYVNKISKKIVQRGVIKRDIMINENRTIKMV